MGHYFLDIKYYFMPQQTDLKTDIAPFCASISELPSQSSTLYILYCIYIYIYSIYLWLPSNISTMMHCTVLCFLVDMDWT